MGRRGTQRRAKAMTAACKGAVSSRYVRRAQRCVDGAPNQMEECNGLGSAWEVVDCDEGMTCEEGACQVRVCVDDEVGCFDATTRGVCNEDGTGFEAVSPAPRAIAARGGSVLTPAMRRADGLMTAAASSLWTFHRSARSTSGRIHTPLRSSSPTRARSQGG